jgi:hypothetical protein
VSLIENPFPITWNFGSNPQFSNETIEIATLYVPIGTIDKYRATRGWNNFVKIVEGIPAGINDIKQEMPTVSHYYNLNGQETLQPHKGLNIVKMSNGKTKKVMVR